MKTRQIVHTLLLIFLGAGSIAFAQVTQDFNESKQQIGDCWQHTGMEITTKNPINPGPPANDRKALQGIQPTGSPAYMFLSPIMYFDARGSIDFKHKLTAADGIERILRVHLLDEEEQLVQTIYTHVYRTANTSRNGNPTNVINVSIPVTWQGIYMLKWEWEGVGGSSVGMIDDIGIDGRDMSDGSNDNGYGYCREDDVVYDTVCAGTQGWPLKVPYVIHGSDWTWDFQPAAAVGNIDSTIVPGPMDSLVHVNWEFAPGSYIIEATEIRPPYGTMTYNVTFYIEVIENPSTVEILADSVCYPETGTLYFEFTGTGPWTVTYTDGENEYTDTFSTPTASVSLPKYTSSKTITVTNFVDSSGCPAEPTALPSTVAAVYPRPSTGLIQN